MSTNPTKKLASIIYTTVLTLVALFMALFMISDVANATRITSSVIVKELAGKRPVTGREVFSPRTYRQGGELRQSAVV